MLPLRTLILALTVLLVLPVDRNAPAADDEAGVRKLINEFVETWNRQDVEAFANLFAPDTNMVILNAQIWRGRQAIQDHMNFLFGKVPADSVKVLLPPQGHGVFKAVTYEFHDIDLKFVHPDVAVANVSWTQVGDPRFKDKPRTGVITFVANRDGGGWIFSGFQNTARP